MATAAAVSPATLNVAAAAAADSLSPGGATAGLYYSPPLATSSHAQMTPVIAANLPMPPLPVILSPLGYWLTWLKMFSPLHREDIAVRICNSFRFDNQLRRYGYLFQSFRVNFSFKPKLNSDPMSSFKPMLRLALLLDFGLKKTELHCHFTFAYVLYCSA